MQVFRDDETCGNSFLVGLVMVWSKGTLRPTYIDADVASDDVAAMGMVGYLMAISHPYYSMRKAKCG